MANMIANQFNWEAGGRGYCFEKQGDGLEFKKGTDI